MKSRIVFLVIVLTAGVFFGCLPAPTQTLEPDTPVEYQIQVQDVLVEPGVQVSLMGSTTLPEGNCVYTQLVQENTALEWWPVGKCFPGFPAGVVFCYSIGRGRCTG